MSMSRSRSTSTHASLFARALLAAGLAVAVSACLEDEGEGNPSGGEPSGPQDPQATQQALTDDLVPISRTASDKSDRPDPPDVAEDFYLALKKSELGKRWFLSSFLTAAAVVGAPESDDHSQPLATVVVTFKVQNDKLFVFHAGDGRAISDVVDTETIIEAYPLAHGVKSFESKTNSDDYILFDPAVGLNRFSVFGERTIVLDSPLVFSRGFRKIKDGFTFEQVISGTIGEAATRVSLKLGLALRRYQEGEGFKPQLAGEENHYFKADPLVVKDQRELQQHVVKWNLAADKPPIVFAISRKVEELKKDPRFAEYDLVGAFKMGLESWNEVFGFKAIEARLAKEGEEPGQDDVNFFDLDSDKVGGAAWGFSRVNPNTGEIRGGNIYFPIGKFEPVAPQEAPPPPESIPPVPSDPAVVMGDETELRASYGWGHLKPQVLCDLQIESLDAVVAAEAPAMGAPTSAKQRVEQFAAQVAAHEMGHILGLRHNFAASTQNPTSSVMDYLPLRQKVAQSSNLGSWDQQAVRYLYGLSPMPATGPFCTDEDVGLVPDCDTFDFGPKPLTDHHIPVYMEFAGLFMAGKLPPRYLARIDGLVPYIRKAADPEVRLQAYNAAVEPLRGPLAGGVSGKARDLLTAEVFARAFIRKLPTRLTHPETVVAAQAPTDPVLSAAVADLKAFTIDTEGQRVFELRLITVDLLRRFKHTTALEGLMQVRAAIVARLPTLMGAVALQEQALVTRIDRHITEYFD